MIVEVILARQPRPQWSPVVVATRVVLGGPALGAIVVWAALILSIFASNILFAVAGSSWQADGLSVLPGAMLMAAPVGLVAARRLIHPARPRTPRHPAQLAPLEQLT